MSINLQWKSQEIIAVMSSCDSNEQGWLRPWPPPFTVIRLPHRHHRFTDTKEAASPSPPSSSTSQRPEEKGNSIDPSTTSTDGGLSWRFQLVVNPLMCSRQLSEQYLCGHQWRGRYPCAACFSSPPGSRLPWRRRCCTHERALPCSSQPPPQPIR